MSVPTVAASSATGEPIEIVPSVSQRGAIEAEPRSLLVLAGPGAGKTYCLTERIGFLIERHGFDPARICAFTFTNKAAGEITHRLKERLGDAAEHITGGTIHAFCADLLRRLGVHVGLEPGFGIADEDYQLSVLRRLEGYRRWHKQTLTRFSAHCFRGTDLFHDDLMLFDRYERFLADRHVVDFDMLVLRAADLLETSTAAVAERGRWDVVLVDEFQDLNPVQYRVVRALARDHRHVFAVGDDEQSIYSWAGADPAVFMAFANDFALGTKDDQVHLEENRRCPHDVFALARALVTRNAPIVLNKVTPRADRVSTFPVQAMAFENERDESAWLVNDIRRDVEAHARSWGDVALLYRKHEIGNLLEAALLNARIPCRLAQGRALADDPVVAYVIAALKVIVSPSDEIVRDQFFRKVLPQTLFNDARASAEQPTNNRDLRQELRHMASHLPRADERARQIRRALADWKNLEAMGTQHTTLSGIVGELLSRRVGTIKSVLEERHDELSDPADNAEVVRLADRLRAAKSRRVPIWIPPMGGVDIAIKGMLEQIGIRAVRGTPRPAIGERLELDEVPSLGLPLGVFKAAQLVELGDETRAFTNFTAIDLETTDRDIAKAEIVEIAAVRVRDGEIVETFTSLVKPRVAITAGAAATHGIGAAELVNAPDFATIWPAFRAFCGDDMVVAHNGYDFDFRILFRMARDIGAVFDLVMFDSLPLARDMFPTSRKLVDLARHFGIPAGRSHRALDDTTTLARVFLELEVMKQSRARKTALIDLLGHLGVALALSDPETMGAEARLLRTETRVFALGRYGRALESYEREQNGDESLPTVDEVIEALGGAQLMERIRAEKTADQRYPAAMLRLRRLIAEIPEGPLHEQLSLFLERVVLSRWDGHETERDRVNLLTLHSTKGLEFSRVYIVGTEDGQLPGIAPSVKAKDKDAEIEEARRLLYVGMTRTIDRLVMTYAATRDDKPTGGHQFLDEMNLVPTVPA